MFNTKVSLASRSLLRFLLCDRALNWPSLVLSAGQLWARANDGPKVLQGLVANDWRRLLGFDLLRLANLFEFAFDLAVL